MTQWIIEIILSVLAFVGFLALACNVVLAIAWAFDPAMLDYAETAAKIACAFLAPACIYALFQ